MSEPLVLVSTIGHVRLLQLNRPKKMNAANRQMLSELSMAYSAAEKDSNIRVLVVSAIGEHFTAGLDLHDVIETAQTSGLNLIPEGGIDPWGIQTSSISKPVIVAVSGYCFTLGIELILNSEIALAAVNTEFCQAEIKHGFAPFGGAIPRFVERCGWGNAMNHILTGNKFDAKNALRIGLVQYVVETNELLTKAISIAELISEFKPQVVRSIIDHSRTYISGINE